MKVTYDAEADALYIQFRPIEPGTAQSRDVTEDVTLDYGPDGKLVGMEVLDASAVLGSDPDRLVLEIAPALRATAR